MIPLLCIVLLVSCRKDIQEHRATDWSVATRLLHYECAPPRLYRSQSEGADSGSPYRREVHAPL